MYFEQFYLGCLAHGSYMIGSGGEAAIVDPQRDVDQYIMAARAVAKKAVGTPVSNKEVKSTFRGIDAKVPLPPGARSGVTAEFLAPYEGDTSSERRAIRRCGRPSRSRSPRERTSRST